LFSITEVGLALFEATVEVLLGGEKGPRRGLKDKASTKEAH
jgi:hypothetical protein